MFNFEYIVNIKILYNYVKKSNITIQFSDDLKLKFAHLAKQYGRAF